MHAYVCVYFATVLEDDREEQGNGSFLPLNIQAGDIGIRRYWYSSKEKIVYLRDSGKDSHQGWSQVYLFIYLF